MTRQWWFSHTSSLVGDGIAAAMGVWLITRITDRWALVIVWAVTSVLLALCVLRAGVMTLLAGEALWVRVAAWMDARR